MAAWNRPPRPHNFQRAMVFVDGTNLIYRLAAAKVRLKRFSELVRDACGGRQLVRAYLYTSQPHHDRALAVHGPDVFDDLRIVLGDAVPTGDGNFREKGVDALLVADLVYHAAVKNYDYAVVFTADTDFARGLKRVEDFGCRTAIVSLSAEPPALLVQCADEVTEMSAADLIEANYAEKIV